MLVTKRKHFFIVCTKDHVRLVQDQAVDIKYSLGNKPSPFGQVGINKLCKCRSRGLSLHIPSAWALLVLELAHFHCCPDAAVPNLANIPTRKVLCQVEIDIVLATQDNTRLEDSKHSIAVPVSNSFVYTIVGI